MRLFFSILLFSVIAQAGFTGDWTGQGTVTSYGKTQNCPGMWATFDESATELKILEINYSCINQVYKDFAYQIQGTEIFDGLEKVGWLKQDEFYIFKKTKDQTLEWHGQIRWNKPGQKQILTFSQDLVNKNAKINLHVKAHFERYVSPAP